MQTVTLGQKGPTVTALGIGTWSWGDKLFWNYGNEYGASQVREAFDAAIESGITFFDTAEVYGTGDSESFLGEFTKQKEPSVKIATKYAPWPWRFTAEAVSEALTDSLQRLQLEQIPLYQVHWPFTFLMSQQTLMNALADELQRGRIGAVGVSNYSAEQMRQAHQILAQRGVPLVANQVQYSLLHRKIESNGILDVARELGVTILAYSPLARGLLTGKYTPEKPNQPDGARRFDSRFSATGLQKTSPVLALLRQFGEKYDKTSAQVALNWLIAQENVIPIPGAKNAEQALQNAGALGWHLSEEEFAQLEQATRPWRG
ncbi:MAG: 2,5-didehydrogluconate reductase [Cyanobacteria bacterium SW_4_48_29]|nr:MAG: 2,5-didehydrogluconate reductase [Cyanobacteria bacterium QS_1_48_34]PSO79167.1 MAG: 2,5-didehydrogluconate reductase [Cyanobacteria bacterium QS_4_48_99]PSO82548.1 MAG: 2,5-didehydrogluconate reductase [Cyanobacteria bacterium QS_5_48_63]PSO88954.1 MAG: 2,5-didehydrogluconate reductase [Cyanobacteria bacterium QS_3_48_167]PSO91934.1 MAG: 2,5-didehydrogluconate reductase [Cyanobacteria bacterium QS_6_48_18]PSO96087.1 MAG: 2,5-didehydrogluconate reductase [Cyanobacteria bacterium QS_9_4